MNCGKHLRRDLRYSSVETFFASVMVGAGETFLPALALAIGASQITAGLIAAVPFLIGSTLQLAAPRVLESVGSYRRWLVLLAILQAISFLPLCEFALAGERVPDWALYLVTTLYWGCGIASGPAWSSWMSSIIPGSLRPRYFAKRNRMGQLGLLLGLLCGGVLLEIAKGYEHELWAFAALFLISGLFRLASAFCFSQQSEKPGSVKHQKRLPLLDVAQRLSQGPEGKLMAFLLIFAVAVNISSPYFNPFMIKKLELSYLAYMTLVAASFGAKIITFQLLGRAARSRDGFQLMRIGLVGAALSPVLWVISSNLYYLALNQIVSGAMWAIYELGVMLVLFGVIRDEERNSILSLYNFASAVMILLGSTIGGQILSLLGESKMTYFLIFGISCAARLLSMIAFDRAAHAAKMERSRTTKVARPSEPHRQVPGSRQQEQMESAS